jgi:hypothetical protein
LVNFVNVVDADAGMDYYIARRAAMIKVAAEAESPAPAASFLLIRAPSITSMPTTPTLSY